MTEDPRPAEVAEPAVGRTAGALLREARQAQGTHIAVLAASIKVSQRKLEALEADRYDELPDATFTRALAKTVCRSLKIDPEPVLALLPQHQVDDRLAHVSQGINARFRDNPSRSDTREFAGFSSPAVWGPLLLIIGALAVYFWPQGWTLSPQQEPATTVVTVPATPAAVEPAPAPVAEPARVAEAPAPEETAAGSTETPAAEAAPPADTPVAAATSPPAAAPADGNELTLHARAASWVEVIDARSTVLVSRLLKAGESLALDGTSPFKVRVGNAADTELVFRGQPVDLTPSTRDNVARLELK